jgi:hypothetical protein
VERNPRFRKRHLGDIETFLNFFLSADLVQQMMRPLAEWPLGPKYRNASLGAGFLQNQFDVIFSIRLEALDVTCCFFKNKITKAT